MLSLRIVAVKRHSVIFHWVAVVPLLSCRLTTSWCSITAVIPFSFVSGGSITSLLFYYHVVFITGRVVVPFVVMLSHYYHVAHVIYACSITLFYMLSYYYAVLFY
jgi:hypothetical protein